MMAYDRIIILKLLKDEAGQYQHDDAVIDNTVRELKGMFNLLDKNNGMAWLMNQCSNSINSVQTTDAYTASDVIKKSKKEAAEETARLGMQVLPEITTRPDAQEEADRLNHYNQAIIGTKEGVMEAFIKIVGTDTLDAVLKDADGSGLKSVDEYNLYDLKEAIISGANRPKAPDVLAQLIAAIAMPYDFRKKIATNFEAQKAKASKVQSYGIAITTSMLVLAILANIEAAQKEDWGREFQPAMQAIPKKYNYNYVHDDASLNDVLTKLAAADSVRNLREVPEPNEETAQAVSEQLALLQNMFSNAPANKANDYEENAVAAESDSESSVDTRRSKKKKYSRQGRDRNQRSKSCGRSQSHDRERPKNKCKHCKAYRHYAGKHDGEKCFYNKAYKGWRPKAVGDELEVKFKPRSKFSFEQGGLHSDSSGGGSDSK
jgi:hypothetical protein